MFCLPSYMSSTANPLEGLVAEVSEFGALHLEEVDLKPQDALQLAKWIEETFRDDQEPDPAG